MKRILVVLFVLIPSLVWGAPFLVCDPQAGVTHYKLTGPAWVPPSVAAQPDGSIKLDVSAAPQGQNSITSIMACIASDASWPSERCSVPLAFDFSRPGNPVGPSNFRLAP